MTRMATRTCLAVSSARMAGIHPNVQSQAVTPTVTAVHRICHRRNWTVLKPSPSPRATCGGGFGGAAIWSMEGRPARARHQQPTMTRRGRQEGSSRGRAFLVVALDHLRPPFLPPHDEDRPAGAVVLLVDRQRA